MSVAALAEVSRLRITGDLEAAGGVVGEVVVRDTAGGVVEFSDRNATQAAAGAERDPLLAPFDLEIEIPAAAILDGPLTLHATTNGASTLLATIMGAPDTLTPRLEPAADAPLTLTASLTADRDSLTALTPGVRDTPTLPLRALLALLDLATLAMLGVLAYVLVRTMRTALATALGLAGITWLAVEPLDAILPAIAGGGRELVIPYAIIATLIISLRRHINNHPLPFLLPTATVLATQKVLEHLNNNHQGHGNNWWGQLIYQWRDSDWLTNQGLARAIFTGDLFRAGETMFYVRVAPRYLLVIAHLLLGENDILIGLIMVIIGFFLVAWLSSGFANQSQSPRQRVLGACVAFIGFLFVGDELIVAFGFFATSEYASWMLMLGLATFLLKSSPQTRTWVTSLIAMTIALMAHFRPNTVFVTLALLAILIASQAPQRGFRSVPISSVWALTSYVVVLSLALIHNLYYGEAFIVFTQPNQADWARFNWSTIWGDSGVRGALLIIWEQIRGLMYWRLPHDPNFAIFFWCSQVILVLSLLRRRHHRMLGSARTLQALLPLTYVLPMLSFNLASYYPRHLVAASLLCLVSALLIWPRDEQRMTSTA
jgi:hypothetical protein